MFNSKQLEHLDVQAQTGLVRRHRIQNLAGLPIARVVIDQNGTLQRQGWLSLCSHAQVLAVATLVYARIAVNAVLTRQFEVSLVHHMIGVPFGRGRKQINVIKMRKCTDHETRKWTWPRVIFAKLDVRLGTTNAISGAVLCCN